MTSAISSRIFSRRRARIVATAAGLTATLVLATGCGGDDSGDGGGADDSPSSLTSTASTGSADNGGGSDGGSDGSGTSTGKVGALEGSWLATKDGKAVALVITGKEAGLFSTGGSVCSGTAGEQSGMEMIELKCTDGNKDRTDGVVDSVDSTTLKVTWEGVGAETYTKAEGGKLPSGLATSSEGSS